MRLKKPIRTAIDQVRISREGPTAIIEHADATISTTNLTIGEEIAAMTDRDILAVHNSIIASQEQLLREWDNTVTEVPSGKPQIKYSKGSDQSVPRGEVLRCIIEDDANGEAVIHIDDNELTLREFGRLLTTYAGWGMRIAFVPDDLVTEQPKIRVREPRNRKR
jgi:hypothetical protein